ncbi:phage holin family protein [Streptomyces sp. NPDC052000]|uniref:phage holin family protein n=1 Tax=Streptomyces sp. NPDC052000 TaxID=3155676 RepID=UPI00344FB339
MKVLADLREGERRQPQRAASWDSPWARRVLPAVEEAAEHTKLWALIITALLSGITTVMAATGKKEINKAGSPTPQKTLAGVQADMNEIKERAKR